MKIAISQNIADISGVPNYVGELAGGLRQQGHEVWVVTPDGPSAKLYQSDGVKVKVLAPQADIDWRYISTLRDWLKEQGIEVLHTNMLKATVNGLIAGRLAKTPVRVAHIHGTLVDWEVPWWKKLPNVVINSLITNLCATDVIALTPSISKQLIHQERIRQSLIRVIPNGINVDLNAHVDKKLLRRELGIADTCPVIGTFSRLTVEKGLPTLLEALPAVWQTFPDLHIALIGDGADRPELESHARNLERADQVHFLGFQPEEKKRDLLAGMDAYVFPSTREGFGISMLEAMAAHTPVVVSDLPVLRDIVTDNQTGLLFEVNSAASLATKITKILSMDDANRQAMAQRAYDMLIQRYTVGRFVDAYLELYSRSLHSRHS